MGDSALSIRMLVQRGQSQSTARGPFSRRHFVGFVVVVVVAVAVATAAAPSGGGGGGGGGVTTCAVLSSSPSLFNATNCNVCGSHCSRYLFRSGVVFVGPGDGSNRWLRVGDTGEVVKPANTREKKYKS